MGQAGRSLLADTSAEVYSCIFCRLVALNMGRLVASNMGRLGVSVGMLMGEVVILGW